MYAQLVTLAAAAPLPAPAAPSWLKTTAITGLFVLIIGLIITWQGGKMTATADKKKISDNAKTSANVGMGLILIVIGLLGAGLSLLATTLGFFTTVGG